MAESIKLATWNVRGLYENVTKKKETKLSKFIDIMECEKINIAAVSETKIIGTGNKPIGSGYQMYYHGEQEQEKEDKEQDEEEHERGGVAIVLDSIWKNKIKKGPLHKSSRIMAIKLDSMSLGWKKNIMVIAVYAPTKNHAGSQTTKFYVDLKKLIKEEYVTRQESYYLVLMGDFNAWIGKKERDGVTGPYGNPKEENIYGKKLIELVSDKFREPDNANALPDLRLKITNTYFPDTIDYTFITLKTLLDYIIVDNDLFGSVEKTKVLEDEDMIDNTWSDHCLVYSIINNPFIPIFTHERKYTVPTIMQEEEPNTSSAADVLVGIAVVGAGLAAGVAALRYFMSSGSDSDAESRNRSRSTSNYRSNTR